MRLDFNKLKTLVVVSEAGSITRAAENLYLTQQAVSAQIKNLEQDLGLVLFQRANRKVFLTKEGAELVATAKEMLTALEQSVHRLRKDAASIEGCLKVGILEEFCVPYLLPNAREFLATFPKVSFEIVFGTDQFLEERLLENDLDVAFIVEFKNKEFFDRVPFASIAYRLVSSPELLATVEGEPLIENLLDLPVVDYAPTCPNLKAWVYKNYPLMMNHVRSKRARTSSADARTIFDLVTNSVGIGLLPIHLIQKQLKTGSLVQLELEEKPINAGLELAVKRRRSENVILENFMEIMSSGETHT